MILNVTEIRSGLEALAKAHPKIAALVTLPEKTAEGQECVALVIGKKPLCRAAGVMITGGMHAREWGGPDICVYFAADLLEAYAAGTGLSYGGKSFTAAAVRNMINRMTIVIFPCVNPDGVAYSHANPGVLWRKNRNPASSTAGNARSIGVDICRNFDFVWDYRTAFHPGAHWAGLASDQPNSDQFHGKGSFSEPESRNVRWLLDEHPQLNHYLDLHSFGGFVIHSWGDDENKAWPPWQNFRNSAWDGKRGLLGGAYGEYMDWFTNLAYRLRAKTVSKAIEAVRGTAYTPHQLFLMPANGPTYPASGVSFDWVYSRHLTDKSKRRVRGFGIEFNKGGRFDITYPELVNLIPEATAGLVRFCEAATPGFLAHLIVCRLFNWFR